MGQQRQLAPGSGGHSDQPRPCLSGQAVLTLVMASGQNFLTRVGFGSIFCSSGWVRSAIYMSWVWVWKISPKKINFFHFFPFESKKISSGPGLNAGWPLIYCGSKVCSGQVRAHL